MKTELSKISNAIPNGEYILIVGLGFDKRCLSILKSLSQHDTSNIKSIIGVQNGSWKEQAQENISNFTSICNTKGVIVGGNCDGATSVADSLYSLLRLSIEKNNNIKFLIDATGFSHELLIIVIGLLNNENKLHDCHILYTGAAEYSFNEQDHKWLSRGVLDIRSVLGFPGEMLPSQKLHLIIMTGFEIERAAEIIARYEPDFLSIGFGGKYQSVSDEHHSYNAQAHKEILSLVQRMRGANYNVNEFEFSCIDPIESKKQILAHVKKYSEHNIVLCPLNTKLSTVGAALAAIENSSIQLCYSEPREYNISGYAKEGNDATIISLNGNL